MRKTVCVCEIERPKGIELLEMNTNIITFASPLQNALSDYYTRATLLRCTREKDDMWCVQRTHYSKPIQLQYLYWCDLCAPR